jgi:paraquat-inducible protein A
MMGDYTVSPLSARRTACHGCDLLNDVPELQPGEQAFCERCGGVLYSNPKHGLDTPLALAIASLCLFLVANAFPFLSFGSAGQTSETMLFSAVLDLYADGMQILAGVVLFTCIVAPASVIAILLYVLLPLHMGRRPPAMPFLSRALIKLQPWAMLDVFMIGVLVAIIKLIKTASVQPGVSFWAFTALTVCVVWAVSSLQGEVMWQRYQELEP